MVSNGHSNQQNQTSPDTFRFLTPIERNEISLDRFSEQVAIYTLEAKRIQLEIEQKRQLLARLDGEISEKRTTLSTVQINLRNVSDQVNQAFFRFQGLQQQSSQLEDEINCQIAHLGFLKERERSKDASKWTICQTFNHTTYRRK